jgi:hypothetical protein
MKLGTLGKSSALLVCAMMSLGAAAIAVDNNTVAVGLHEMRTPVDTLNLGAKTTLSDTGFQHAFFITGEDAGTVFLMDTKHDVGGITKMKTVDLALPAKKLMVDAKMHGGGSGGLKYDTAKNGSSDKVAGTGQQYGSDMAHRAGVVIASAERPDTSA